MGRPKKERRVGGTTRIWGFDGTQDGLQLERRVAFGRTTWNYIVRTVWRLEASMAARRASRLVVYEVDEVDNNYADS